MPTFQERRQGFVEKRANLSEMSESDRVAWETIESRYRPHNSNRADLERQWSINKAFGEGHQWIDWDSNAWRVVSRNLGRRKILEKRNFMRGIRERQIAALTGFKPDFKGIPQSTDIEDRQAADIASKVSNHYFYRGRVPIVMQKVAGWAWDTGTGFLGVEWDAQAGGHFQVPMMNEAGEPEVRNFAQGDVYTYAADPFEIHVDPNAKEDDHVRWMMEVTKPSIVAPEPDL